jgi:hypothetical protein
LAVLAVLLYAPSNLDKTGLLEGVIVQVLEDALLLIVENEVVGDESLDDRFTRWICMMIDFILSGLGLFAQARSNVATKSHDIKKGSLTESLNLLAMVI